MERILHNLFKTKKPIIADGAMGTMLIKSGLSAGKCPEAVNISTPKILENIHKEYKKAGAGILQTNTFGANRIKLKSYGLENKLQEIITEGVKIAKDVAGGDTLVGLSVGPTGKLLKPYGTHSFDEIFAVFKEQIGYGVEAGADLICIETMGDMGELKAAYLAAREYEQPVSCSVSFEKNGRTLMGTGADTYIKTIVNWNSDIIGSNCVSPEDMLKILKELSIYAHKPIYIRANAGEPILKDNKTIYPMGADEFANYAVKFVEQGAAILGGCCGTMPEHISKLREFVHDKEIKLNSALTSEKWLTSSVRSVQYNSDIPNFSLKIKAFLENNLINIKKAADSLREKEEVQIFTIDFEGECPENTAEFVEYIQAIFRQPFIFQGNCLEVFESALRLYKGVSGVKAPELKQTDLLEIIKKYGGEFI